MKNPEVSYLTKNNLTICFAPVAMDANCMQVTYQQTLDPNEELPEDLMTRAEARTAWKQYVSEGFKKAAGWHACKRGSEWGDD